MSKEIHAIRLFWSSLGSLPDRLYTVLREAYLAGAQYTQLQQREMKENGYTSWLILSLK